MRCFPLLLLPLQQHLALLRLPFLLLLKLRLSLPLLLLPLLLRTM
jgi:hypothetical protein